MLLFMTPDTLWCYHWNDLVNLYLNLTKESTRNLQDLEVDRRAKSFTIDHNLRNLKSVTSGCKLSVTAVNKRL